MSMKIKSEHLGTVVSFYHGNYTTTVTITEEMENDYMYWIAKGLDYIFEEKPKAKYKGVENEEKKEKDSEA
jgi:hypothetical protein